MSGVEKLKPQELEHQRKLAVDALAEQTAKRDLAEAMIAKYTIRIRDIDARIRAEREPA